MATSFSEPKLKTFPFRPRSPALARLLQSCVVILAINWCAQGMRGMDGKELSFRLLLEGLVALLLAVPMVSSLGAPVALATALLIAHSLSFTLNGQAWVCARYCRWYRRDPAVLEAHLRRLVQRLQGLGWLREAVCIGSAAGVRSRAIAPTWTSAFTSRPALPAGCGSTCCSCACAPKRSSGASRSTSTPMRARSACAVSTSASRC